MPYSHITLETLEDTLTKSKSEISTLLQSIHPADSASLIRELSLDNQIKLIESLNHELAGQILSQLQDISSAEEFVLAEKLSIDFLASIINAMPTDNAVDALLTFKKLTVSSIWNKLSPEKSTTLEEMLRYDDETAGGLMNDDFISLPSYATVSEAISMIKKQQSHELLASCRYIYVTNKEERLIGSLPIVDLLVHPDSKILSDVMNPDVFSVNADVDQEKVAEIFTKYDLVVLPVINRGRRVIGRITVDDIINVISEETDEDFYKLVGTDDTEKETPSSIRIASIRLPWLLSTLLGSFLSCSIIKYFNGHIGQIIALFFFMPVITAMSGNIGVQCSTLIVRGLATGFIQMGAVRHIFLKEFKIGSIIAVTCGLCAGICSYLFIEKDPKLGLTVGISMWVCVLFSSFSGTAVPLLLKKLNCDPAIASGPIITTFNDITGLLIYFSIAMAILL